MRQARASEKSRCGRCAKRTDERDERRLKGASWAGMIWAQLAAEVLNLAEAGLRRRGVHQ